VRAGETAARLHMAGGVYPTLRPGTKVDLLTSLAAQGILQAFFAVVRADNGRDFTAQAIEDMESILSVHLKEEDRNLGPASGEKLRTLRAQELALRRRAAARQRQTS
jgi:tRNA nucleotidyltransferase (CCA-adding enzyme)